jgi:hypothetical protein
MSQYILGIEFLGPANSGETVSMSWTGAGGSVVTNTTTFVPTRLTSQQTTIGTDALSQATNFYNSVSTDYIGNFYVNQVGTQVYVSSRNTVNPMSGATTSSNISFSSSAIGIITNVDQLNGCVYFTLSAPYSGETGVAIETSTNGGSSWTYSAGGITSPRCSSVQVTVPTLYRLRGLNSFSGQTSNIYSLIPGFDETIQDVRARSPYLLISTGTTAQTFTESVFTISQFEGSIFDYSTAPISYVKTKQKITPFQDNIWINISNLVREDLEVDIDYYQDNDYTTARNLSTNESKWVYINTVNQYLSTGVTTGDTFYFVVDGYIEPSETQGLPNLLITGDKRYIYRGSNERLYFKTDNLTGATYSTPTTGPTSISFSGDSDLNYGYVKSIKVNIPLTEDRVTYTFNYSGQTPQTVTYYLYDECKYENYDLVFKNKYGMMESLSMSKKSSKTLNVDSTDYLRSIVNLEGEYNVNRHTKKQFNVNGMEEWTLNTEFLPEYMNAPIKEAMLTEEMWLIDSLGNIIPVVRMDQSIAFKTSLNDKMIQYTIRVGLSHNTVQNII